MPAIQPARLKHQAALLAEHFGDTAAYIRSLHHLLDSYADRAFRPGQSGNPRPLTRAYQVKLPVLRQVLQELVPRAAEAPEEALALCDALWSDSYLEFNLLAAWLLGQVPPAPPEPVLDRVRRWTAGKPEAQLLAALLDPGLARLRQENHPAVLALVEAWLDGSDVYNRQLGLRALLPLVKDPGYENLPVFYRLLQPLARSVPAPLRPDLLEIVEALARRSPRETAYFLRQTLTFPDSVDTPWLIRQSVRAFPADLQESLKESVRGMVWRPGKPAGA